MSPMLQFTLCVKVMVQYWGAGQSGKLAPPVEAFENQHFKLTGEDYANLP